MPWGRPVSLPECLSVGLPVVPHPRPVLLQRGRARLEEVASRAIWALLGSSFCQGRISLPPPAPLEAGLLLPQWPGVVLALGITRPRGFVHIRGSGSHPFSSGAPASLVPLACLPGRLRMSPGRVHVVKMEKNARSPPALPPAAAGRAPRARFPS